MLTDGVEDASTAMCENERIKRNAVSISGKRTRFSKYSMSGSPYVVDVELIQTEKTAFYCAMFC